MRTTAIAHSKPLLACLALVALALPTMALQQSNSVATSHQDSTKGLAVAYPWVFVEGNDTSRTMAVTTTEEIARKAGYSSVPGDIAAAAWASNNLPEPSMKHMPSKASLRAFGIALHADRVLYGSISWHTRSIWVNAGPKTISTATVNAYVFDVSSRKVVFRKKGIEGRSDEKSNSYKLAADVLFTPLVTAVSGGPATPHEQRAVQIALGLAFYDWVNPVPAKK